MINEAMMILGMFAVTFGVRYPVLAFASRISLPVVQGASGRQQTLRLTVSDASHPDAQGTECAIDAFQVDAATSPAFPVVPVILLVVGCVAAGTLLGRATIRARSAR